MELVAQGGSQPTSSLGLHPEQAHVDLRQNVEVHCPAAPGSVSELHPGTPRDWVSACLRWAGGVGRRPGAVRLYGLRGPRLPYSGRGRCTSASVPGPASQRAVFARSNHCSNIAPIAPVVTCWTRPAASPPWAWTPAASPAGFRPPTSSQVGAAGRPGMTHRRNAVLQP